MPALIAVHQSSGEVPFVLTQPERPAGRGRSPQASPVARKARELGLALRQPQQLVREQVLGWCAPPDLMVVVAYGLLLPQWLLDWPRRGCVNVHASLLPRWRGAAPIQRALAAGDTQTGVTLMQMVAKLDAGPVFAERPLAIGAEETAGELHDRLAELAAALLRETLPALAAGTLAARPQPSQGATYAHKLSKSEAALDWTLPATVLALRVRAFNPWPVAEARLSDGRRLRIWRAASLATALDAVPGTIATAGAEGIDVAAGEGVLRLLSVQAPSGRVMSAAQYLHAHPLGGVSFVC